MDRNSRISGIRILLKAIQDGTLLGPNTFANADPEDILAGRDNPAFGDRCMRLYKQLKDANLSEGEAAGLLQLREKAFKISYQYCPGCDLPGDISDDFDLIARGITTNYDDEFLTGLLESYIKGRIPHTIVVADPGVSLRSLFETLRKTQ